MSRRQIDYAREHLRKLGLNYSRNLGAKMCHDIAAAVISGVLLIRRGRRGRGG